MPNLLLRFPSNQSNSSYSNSQRIRSNSYWPASRTRVPTPPRKSLSLALPASTKVLKPGSGISTSAERADLPECAALSPLAASPPSLAAQPGGPASWPRDVRRAARSTGSMCHRAGYNRISCASIRSPRRYVTVHSGQNGQHSTYGSPQAAAGPEMPRPCPSGLTPLKWISQTWVSGRLRIAAIGSRFHRKFPRVTQAPRPRGTAWKRCRQPSSVSGLAVNLDPVMA
jgi:hypothetical protein